MTGDIYKRKATIKINDEEKQVFIAVSKEVNGYAIFLIHLSGEEKVLRFYVNRERAVEEAVRICNEGVITKGE